MQINYRIKEPWYRMIHDLLSGVGVAVPAAGHGRHHVRLPYLRLREGGQRFHFQENWRILSYLLQDLRELKDNFTLISVAC